MSPHSLKNLAIGATLAVIGSAAMATHVGVAVTLGEPGFYGRIVLGNVPPPRVIYSAPVVIDPQPMTVVRTPIYLRVPYGHEKHWDKHCRQYNACGQPVYFVQEPPRRQPPRGPHYGDPSRGDRNDHHDERPGRGRGHDRGDHDDHRGHGRGHGGGHRD